MLVLAALLLLALSAARTPVSYCNSTSDATWRLLSCNYPWRKDLGVAPNCPETKSGASDGVWRYKCPLADEEEERCNVSFFVDAGRRELYCDEEWEELADCDLTREGGHFVYSCLWRPYW